MPLNRQTYQISGRLTANKIRQAQPLSSAVRGCLALVALLSAPVLAQSLVPLASSLTELSLEELANIEITSVSKKPEGLNNAPASVYVITANDIRRYGATSLPEALRLAPNLLVAQVSADQYAISARGFNGTISNKLQVLIDGRIVYTPLFSGVFWDAQDVLLDDVERIEVISGPAAALWGANAVNGVINVITRNAADTQGTLVNLGGGNREANVAARHGGELGENGHYRAYTKWIGRQETEQADHADVDDDWERHQAGFRLDWQSGGDNLRFQGDLYRGRLDQTAPGSREIEGANLVARWQRELPSGARLSLGGYHDYRMRDYPGFFTEHLNTSQIDLLYNLPAIGRHQLQWGMDYRYSMDRVSNSDTAAFLPAHEYLDWISLYGQDAIRLNDNLHLLVNARIEHNDYTGAELMPAARLSWTPGDDQLLWGAVSRSVRTPSRIDRDFYSPGDAPFLLQGGHDFRSETATTYELGYRLQPNQRLSWSVTVFHSDYDHLRTVEPTGGGQLMIDNGLEGSSTGVETWGSFQAAENWRLSAGFITLKQRLHLKSGSADINDGNSEGNDPSHQWQLRSQADLGRNVYFDAMLRRVGKLPDPSVPDYMALDMRLAWLIQPDLELSLNGKNLLDPQHPEFGYPSSRSEIERSFYFGLRWSF